MGAYWALVVFRSLSRRLPEAAFRRMANAIVFIGFMLLPAKRANMYRNLMVVLGGAAGTASPALVRRARFLAHRSMLSYGEVLASFLAVERMVPKVWHDIADTPGLQHLDRVSQAGRGALFVTAHFGHWDMAGAAVARRCPGKVVVVAETFANTKLNDLVVGARKAYGVGVVPMENVRQMARVLREGKVLGILADRPVPGDEGVAVTFFGQETRFPAGTAVLATLAQCPILVGSLRRRRDGRFEGVVLPPIEPVRTGNREADIAATMQLVVHHLEEIIRRSPHQWYMFRSMWPGATTQARTPASACIRRLVRPWVAAARARRISRRASVCGSTAPLVGVLDGAGDV